MPHPSLDSLGVASAYLATKCRPSHLRPQKAPNLVVGVRNGELAMSIANLPRPAIPLRSIVLSHGYIGLLRPVTSLRIIGVYSVVVVLLWLMLFLV